MKKQEKIWEDQSKKKKDKEKGPVSNFKSLEKKLEAKTLAKNKM